MIQQPIMAMANAPKISKVHTTKIPTMNIFSWALEDWNITLQFASLVLLGLTFAIGGGAIVTGYFVGKRQEVRIANAGRDAAEATKKAAEANEGTARALADAASANERTKSLEI